MDENKGFQNRAKAYYDGVRQMDESEKRFEEYIEDFLISEKGDCAVKRAAA